MLFMYLSMLETEDERFAFEKLYEKARHTCLHVALAITKNQAMAEDAIHNAFLYAIKNKEKIFALPCGKLKSYIVLITKLLNDM